MNHYAHIVNARFLTLTNDPKEAISELNYAIEQSPEINFYRERFMFYYNNKDYNKALSDLEKVIESDGSKINLKIDKAMILSYLGEKEKSNEIIESLWEYEINQDEVYFGRGKLHFFCNKDYHSAIRDFTSALEINPYYSEVYLFRAFAKWNIDDITGRDEDIKLYNRTNR
jgi:tetratricopeptide (TPR) repeat protein